MPRQPCPRRRRESGLTLIESAITTATAAAIAGSVLPAITDLRAQQAVAGAAAEFETDVQHTRTLAVGDGVSWRIGFESADGDGCYVIHTGAAGACRCLGAAAPSCDGDAQALRAVRFPAGGAVTLAANVRSMAFDPLRGTSTPAGTVRFTGRDGRALHQVVNVMGRVRSCSPDRSLPGYRAC